MKNPLTLAGIEPASFRFVAQHLNHSATAVPLAFCITCQFIPRILHARGLIRILHDALAAIVTILCESYEV